MATAVTIKRGNIATFRMTLKYGGAAIEILSEALLVVFKLWDVTDKELKFETAWEQSPGNTEKFSVDTPAVGTVTVTMDSAETGNLEPGSYYIALQAEWGPADKLEWDFRTQLRVVPDRIA